MSGKDRRINVGNIPGYVGNDTSNTMTSFSVLNVNDKNIHNSNFTDLVSDQTGFINKNGYSFKKDQAAINTYYYNPTTDNNMECLKQCKDLSFCNAYTFDQQDNKCTLYNSIPNGFRENNNKISGYKNNYKYPFSRLESKQQQNIKKRLGAQFLMDKFNITSPSEKIPSENTSSESFSNYVVEGFSDNNITNCLTVQSNPITLKAVLFIQTGNKEGDGSTSLNELYLLDGPNKVSDTINLNGTNFNQGVETGIDVTFNMTSKNFNGIYYNVRSDAINITNIKLFIKIEGTSSSKSGPMTFNINAGQTYNCIAPEGTVFTKINAAYWGCGGGNECSYPGGSIIGRAGSYDDFSFITKQLPGKNVSIQAINSNFGNCNSCATRLQIQFQYETSQLSNQIPLLNKPVTFGLIENTGRAIYFDAIDLSSIKITQQITEIAGSNTKDVSKQIDTSNGIVSNILSKKNWTVHFQLSITADNSNWRNIFFYGNNDAERVPAAWIWAGDPWKINFCMAKPGNVNSDFNFSIPSQFRKFNKEMEIVVNYSRLENNNYIASATVNGVYTLTQYYNYEFGYLADRNLYIKCPWYENFKDYQVKNLTFTYRNELFLMSSNGQGSYNSQEKFNNYLGSLKTPYYVIRKGWQGFSATHQYIVYKRITPSKGVDMWSLFRSDWYDGGKGVKNNFHVDFDLYNSIESAMKNESRWTYCNFNDPGVGAFRDCGQYGNVAFQWQSNNTSSQWEYYVFGGESTINPNIVNTNQIVQSYGANAECVYDKVKKPNTIYDRNLGSLDISSENYEIEQSITHYNNELNRMKDFRETNIENNPTLETNLNKEANKIKSLATEDALSDQIIQMNGLKEKVGGKLIENFENQTKKNYMAYIIFIILLIIILYYILN